MEYISTRDAAVRLTGEEAVKVGLSRDGGLFVPERVPRLGKRDLETLRSLDYPRRAAYIMGKFLLSTEEIESYAVEAYKSFDVPSVAPLRQMDGNTWCLELWHGPTSAFKDLALQMLPRLLTASLRGTGEARTACVLTATSGDTGKAALAGFADVEQTKILVFYPENGVSQIQQIQMSTQEGRNVGVVAVRGNFDDAQGGVKAIFSDAVLREELSRRGYFLTSANSINLGRLLPQIVYYISAYCDLLNTGAVEEGRRVVFCVPTGNFGNILAAYYAWEMGLPVKKLVCASNRNNVLTDFIRTGVYDRNRPFHTTMSPSMDILVSSNLERLLFDMAQGDSGVVKGCMASLAQDGRYAIGGGLLEKLQGMFYGGFCGEGDTAATIGLYYKERGYLMDPHTAVAAKVLADYRREAGDYAPAVVCSTASPFKFCGSVLRAIGVEPVENSLDRIAQLEVISGVTAPVGLAALKGKPVRFTAATDVGGMEEEVRQFLP